ncbi:EpsG family protein (plasmid) [Sphingomonas sp. NY01]|uniref:EpsG family protein n=1 Tax=Sphingomonas sp. NY01 TaxID=2968057 RepID=UPI00315C4FE6
MTYGTIALVIVLFGVFTDPTRYADFDTYVYYLDALVYYPPPSWIYFELFSNLNLLAAHWLTRSVLSAIIFAHYMLGVVFMLATLVAYPPRRTSWQALLFTFAVLGPLLAFVTLRATPAYFLIAIGVRYAINRRPIAWLCLAMAASFHISALLAAPAMMLLYFERNLPSILRSNRPRSYYFKVALVIIAFCVLLPSLSGSFNNIIKSIPVISKYEVYTDVREGTVTQIGHYIFLVFISMLVMAFIYAQNESSRILNIYVLVSYALYVLLFFATSPIVAFRQTPFWIMPLIAVLPWDRLGVRRATAPGFVITCAVLMAFQFSQVYV